MFKLILYKELREIIGSSKFAVTFAVCSILIILAFFAGAKNYQTGVLEYNASKAAQRLQYESETDWERVSSYQVYLPPEPLAALVMGVSNDLGRAANIDGRNTPIAYDSNYSQQPVFAVFRFLDLEFVFQIILSLFAILFAFDAVNGEKERGTLKLSFANALPRANYILGKLTGSFLALALSLLIPILIGVLLVPLMRIPLSSDEWIRLGLFVVCGLLYLGVFLTLSVFISCLTQRSSSSFLFLLVIWVCSVLIVPRASILLAGNMVEVPSLEEINFQRSQLMRQNSSEMNERLREFFRELTQEQMQSGDNSPEAMEKTQKKVNEFLEKINDENNKKVENLTSRLNEERRNKQVQQEKLAFGISRISPTAVFNLAATTLCGTSLELKNYFQEQAALYTESFAEFIRKKTGRNIGGPRIVIRLTREEEEAQKSQPINPREIPEFLYQPPELSGILGDALPDIAILMLLNLIFFSGAFLSFLRYDLR
jgi:ABC-type transport system involved in multi-copper enzyme maturation permease subunit